MNKRNNNTASVKMMCDGPPVQIDFFFLPRLFTQTRKRERERDGNDLCRKDGKNDGP